MFADEDDAEKEAAAMDYSVPFRRFRTEVVVDVNAKEEFSLDDLKAFLEATWAHSLDSLEEIPALDDADIAIIPDWQSLEEEGDD